jgi:hypothetical protein
MLMRSTGLGKSELVTEIDSLKPQGDYLIMEMHTTEPVRWKVRGALSRKDLKAVLKAMLKGAVIAWLANLKGWVSNPEHPGDF